MLPAQRSQEQSPRLHGTDELGILASQYVQVPRGVSRDGKTQGTGKVKQETDMLKQMLDGVFKLMSEVSDSERAALLKQTLKGHQQMQSA